MDLGFQYCHWIQEDPVDLDNHWIPVDRGDHWIQVDLGDQYIQVDRGNPVRQTARDIRVVREIRHVHSFRLYRPFRLYQMQNILHLLIQNCSTFIPLFSKIYLSPCVFVRL
jgi:hypothetical protein